MAQRSTSPRRTPVSRTSSGPLPKRRTRAKSNPVRRPRDHLLRADLEDRERMVEQICRVIIEFAQDFGLNALSTRRAFEKAQQSVARSPYRLCEAVRYQTLRQISEILGAWYREPALLNEQGDPRHLPLTGVKSFATLARRFLPRFKPREIADILIAERLLQRDRNGDVVPLRRAARFASNSTLMLDRVPALLHALSSTLRHNARATEPGSSTRCERGTTIDRLPVEKIPAYNEYVKTLAHTLLNQTDNWGSQRQVPDGVKDRRRLARVGVEVFAYVEAESMVRRRKPA